MTGPVERRLTDPLAWLEAQMLERRTVLMRGPLDDHRAGRVVAQLMMLDADGDDEINLQIDSGGGPLQDALTVMDTIDLLGVPVRAVCMGRAEGSALGVFAVATVRLAAPHARFRLAEPSSETAGNAAAVTEWARQALIVLGQFVQRLASATGRPGEHLEAELSLGRWLDAEEAVAYGLADDIWRPPAGREPAPRGPLGFRPPG